MQGVNLMQIGKTSEAETAFKDVIQKHPEIAESHQLLGLIYAAREDFINAQECFKQAVRIEPNNAAYNSNYANTLQDTWKIEESIPFYQKAIELKPDFVDAHFNLGNSFRKLQRFPEALKCYEQAKRINPQYVKCYINTAVVYEAMKQIDRAIAEIFEALKFAPQSFELLSYLAVMYSIKKEYEPSMNYFRKAFETGQADDKFFLNYGTVCIELNQPAEAAKAFLKSAELNPVKTLY